jgi:hypothetical protein
MTLALDFVKPGTELKVAYFDKSDKKIWYQGFVTKIGPITWDRDGHCFMTVDVQYENVNGSNINNEIVTETLYEHEFDNLGCDECWTLVYEPAVRIVKQLVQNEKSMKILKEQVNDYTSQVKTLLLDIDKHHQYHQTNNNLIQHCTRRSRVCSVISYNIFMALALVSYIMFSYKTLQTQVDNSIS